MKLVIKKKRQVGRSPVVIPGNTGASWPSGDVRWYTD